MKLLIRNIRLPYHADPLSAIELLKKRGFEGVTNLRVFKRSLDARKKPDIYFVYTLLCEATKYPAGDPDIQPYLPDSFPDNIKPVRKVKQPPVIVGFGPCGMFCGLLLARLGYNPIIIERGSDIDRRRMRVNAFFAGGGLDSRCNVQYGEGGAGAFSDGKLITRVNDPRCDFILRELVSHGAPEEILYSAKPHIGTDKLAKIVKNIREEIISLGGCVRFDLRVADIRLTPEGYRVELDPYESLYTPAVFLATGHSALDVYEMLINNGYQVQPKDYSVGFRIEHLQSDVDASLYGDALNSPYAHLLPKGEYTLSYRAKDRGVYSFCMCPGGEVVASSSEPGSVVTNGMSNYARDGRNANSAICVSVYRSDYGDTPQKAMEFRKNLEKAAFKLGGSMYMAPCQTLGDFLDDRPTRSFEKIYPTYTNEVRTVNLRRFLPSFLENPLMEALGYFGKRYDFFADRDAPLTAVESRTSSPCRIVRGDDLCIPGNKLFYPCGEGAGYAGGITSAALDGLRCAVAFATGSD